MKRKTQSSRNYGSYYTKKKKKKECMCMQCMEFSSSCPFFMSFSMSFCAWSFIICVNMYVHIHVEVSGKWLHYVLLCGWSQCPAVYTWGKQPCVMRWILHRAAILVMHKQERTAVDSWMWGCGVEGYSHQRGLPWSGLGQRCARWQQTFAIK